MSNKSALTKILKYTVFIGPMLVVMGLSAGFVSGIWVPVPAGLTIAGFVVFGLWLIARETTGEGFWGKRSTEAGTNFSISLLSALIIVGLINYMGLRFAVRLDLTENQRFSLAPQTKQLVRNLPQPVKVWVFDDVEPSIGDLQVLRNYRRQAPSLFNFEYVNPWEEDVLALQFQVKNLGDVYLSDLEGKERRYVQNIKQRNLQEASLTDSLAKLISDRKLKVYFLQGHGERQLGARRGGMSQAIAALESKNFEIEPLFWAKVPEVPDDASAVVVSSPKRALFKQEVRALQDYLDSGGSLLLTIDYKTSPGLSPLLEEWGVRLDDRLAVDVSGKGKFLNLGPTTPLITDYGDHTIVRAFTSGYSFYPLARSIETTELEGVEAVPLLMTDERSWAESDPEQRVLKFNEESDKPGPLTLAVALTRTIKVTEPPSPDSQTEKTESTPESSSAEEGTELSESRSETGPESELTDENPESAESAPSDAEPEASESGSESAPTEENPDSAESSDAEPEESQSLEKEVEARMVVFGTSEFAINGPFELQLNGDVFLNSVSWLSRENEEIISIRPKQATNRRIKMEETEYRLVQVMALAIFPLLGLGLALFRWLQRR